MAEKISFYKNLIKNITDGVSNITNKFYLTNEQIIKISNMICECSGIDCIPEKYRKKNVIEKVIEYRLKRNISMYGIPDKFITTEFGKKIFDIAFDNEIASISTNTLNIGCGLSSSYATKDPQFYSKKTYNIHDELSRCAIKNIQKKNCVLYLRFNDIPKNCIKRELAKYMFAKIIVRRDFNEYIKLIPKKHIDKKMAWQIILCRIERNMTGIYFDLPEKVYKTKKFANMVFNYYVEKMPDKFYMGLIPYEIWTHKMYIKCVKNNILLEKLNSKYVTFGIVKKALKNGGIIKLSHIPNYIQNKKIIKKTIDNHRKKKICPGWILVPKLKSKYKVFYCAYLLYKMEKYESLRRIDFDFLPDVLFTFIRAMMKDLNNYNIEDMINVAINKLDTYAIRKKGDEWKIVRQMLYEKSQGKEGLWTK